MRRFGKPQKPFYIVLSKDDKALWLSRTIGGGVTRVGDNPNTAELAALGATVMALSHCRAKSTRGLRLTDLSRSDGLTPRGHRRGA